MMFFVLCFLVLLAVGCGQAFARHLDRVELQRKKFYLAVCQDLKKLDEMIEQEKKRLPKNPRIDTIDTRWVGRN
jgi:hypothetical protein